MTELQKLDQAIAELKQERSFIDTQLTALTNERYQLIRAVHNNIVAKFIANPSKALDIIIPQLPRDYKFAGYLLTKQHNLVFNFHKGPYVFPFELENGVVKRAHYGNDGTSCAHESDLIELLTLALS